MWFYKPAQDSNIAKVERLEKCSNFVKDRQNVRILVWEEHCALIKNVQLLLERPNTKHAKFSSGFVIIVLIGLFLNIDLKLMNVVSKSNQRLFALS